MPCQGEFNNYYHDNQHQFLIRLVRRLFNDINKINHLAGNHLGRQSLGPAFTWPALGEFGLTDPVLPHPFRQDGRIPSGRENGEHRRVPRAAPAGLKKGARSDLEVVIFYVSISIPASVKADASISCSISGSSISGSSISCSSISCDLMQGVVFFTLASGVTNMIRHTR